MPAISVIAVAAFCLSWLALLSPPALRAEEPLPDITALDTRLARERRWESEGLRLLPYKVNYFLPLSFSAHPNQANRDLFGGAGLQNAEVKFQISLRIPVARRIFWQHGDLHFAYT
jgi:phospholipase A1